MSEPKSEPRDEFYVGYLPLPVAHRRALVLILPVIVVVFAVAAGVLLFEVVRQRA